jgi:hypothetical protein
MSPAKRDAKRQTKARQRRHRNAQERLECDRRQAQQAAEALEQALQDLDLPEHLVAEIAGRLQSQQQLLGKIVGVMFPSLFGCRTNTELCRVRGWDKNLPSRLLGALPKRSWIKRLRRLGLDVLVPLWHHAAHASAATRSRWQWTWVGDDSVFKKYGEQLGLVGTWWSGQEHRVLSGIDGVLLVVVVGEGKLVVPVDFAIRRPDPTGPGAPCRDKLHWVQGMLDGRVAAFRRRGVVLPPPMVVADSWFVRDHRIPTRGRLRPWRLASLAPLAFSSGSGLISPVYNVQQSEPVGCHQEMSWNHGLSPTPLAGRFPLLRRTGNRPHLPCKPICTPCTMSWISSTTV